MNQLLDKEIKRRMDIVEDVHFRQIMSNLAYQLGVRDWEKNKHLYLLFMANQICKIQNDGQARELGSQKPL